MAGKAQDGAAGAAVRSPRDRYREQVREEVKAHAWDQVAATGASALSLNAIAKLMGVSGPALYRYFRNRDELVTALVLDAYRDMGETCRAAAEGVGPPEARLTAVAGALRAWALDTPHRYLLIYGTPVPGYSAPEEATALASAVMALMLDAFAEIPLPPGVDGTLARHLVQHRDWAGDRVVPASVLSRALLFWTRLHGVVSLEVAGHFAGMGFDPAVLYAAEVAAALGRSGSAPPNG